MTPSKQVLDAIWISDHDCPAPEESLQRERRRPHRQVSGGEVIGKSVQENLGKKSFSLAFFGLGKCWKIRKMAKEKNVLRKFSQIFLHFPKQNHSKEKEFFPRFSLFSKTSAGGNQGRVGGVGGKKQNKHTASGMTDLHDIRTYHFPKIRKNLGKKFIPHFPYFPSKNEFFRDGK